MLVKLTKFWWESIKRERHRKEKKKKNRNEKGDIRESSDIKKKSKKVLSLKTSCH